MIRRGNLVAFWRPFVVALIVLLALVLWLGSSDTQVLIHNSKSKMRGELTPWILGYLCKIWWKWELPGVKMRRLCRPSWSSLGNRSPASRGSADLLLLDVGTIWEQFALFLPLFHCEDVLCLGDRTFASSTPATSRNHGYWGCQQGWHWLLDADINVNSADRVNHCQKQTWTWPLKICHVPSRHPGILQWSEHDVPHSDGSCCCCPSSWPTSEDRSWVSWDFDYFKFQVGRSLYDNHIVQDTHVDWNRQEESACQVWQVLFVSTITLPLPVLWWSHVRSPCSSATQPPAPWCAPSWRWGPPCCGRVQLVFQVVLEQVYWKDLKQSEDCVNGEACCDGKALTRKQKSEQVRQDKEKVSNSDK